MEANMHVLTESMLILTFLIYLFIQVEFRSRNGLNHVTVVNDRSTSSQKVNLKCGGHCSTCEPWKDGVFIYKTDRPDFTKGKLPVDYNLNLGKSKMVPCY